MKDRYCTLKSLYGFCFVLINRHPLLTRLFVPFSCSYWGVMITPYGIPIFQPYFLTRAYHYTQCGFPSLVLCLTSLELWQRWSLTSLCEIISRQALCVNEWKTLTTYSWAVSGCSFLSKKNWPNAHTKNLNHLPLSPVSHMWTFSMVSLESFCLSILLWSEPAPGQLLKWGLYVTRLNLPVFWSRSVKELLVFITKHLPSILNHTPCVIPTKI